jgi:hypothetical protein
LVALCAAGIAGSASSAPQQTQDQVVVVITDYELPPATLDAAWKIAPIGVRGQIQSSVVRERAAGRRPVPLAVTEHRVKLLEILKGASAIGTRAELVVAQDTVEASASRMGVPHKGGGGLFKPAEEYVLFLEPLPGQAAFGVVWGGGGSFRLLGDDAIVPGPAQRMWQFREQLTRDEFMHALRSRREDKHVK